MDNVVKYLLIAGAVVITMGILGFAFMFQRSGKQIGSDAQASIEALATTMNESEFTDYDGTTISGVQAQSLLTKWKSEQIYVYVKTKVDTTGTYYNYDSATLANAYTVDSNEALIHAAQTKGSTNYITPSGKFFCTVQRDANGTIIGVTMVQQ